MEIPSLLKDGTHKNFWETWWREKNAKTMTGGKLFVAGIGDNQEILRWKWKGTQEEPQSFTSVRIVTMSPFQCLKGNIDIFSVKFGKKIFWDRAKNLRLDEWRI